MSDDFCQRFYPGPLKWVGNLVLRTMCNDRLLDCLGQPRPTRLQRKASSAVLGTYVKMRRIVPASSADRLGQWDAEYGPNPESAVVGPKWATDVTAATRKYATVGR